MASSSIEGGWANHIGLSFSEMDGRSRDASEGGRVGMQGGLFVSRGRAGSTKVGSRLS